MAAESTLARSGAIVLQARLALYAGVAVVLFLIERLLPNPLPWLRLGLANAVTVIVLLQHGARAAAVVVALRLLLGGFLSGSLFGPQMLLAAAGGSASLAVMALAAGLPSRPFSALGISLLGATAHAAAQLATVATAFTGAAAVRPLVPLFLTLALVTGALIGLAADIVLRRVALARSGP